MILRQPAAMLTVDQGLIIYREAPFRPALRLFIALIGLGIAFGIPAAWLANAHMGLPLVSLLVLGGVAVLSFGFGALLLALSLVSVTEVRIDPSADFVTRIRRGPLLNDRTQIPRTAIGPPVLTLRDGEDGPFPLLTLTLPRGRRLEMACFADRAEAEAWRDRITAALRG
jgi:hypothetical protein